MDLYEFRDQFKVYWIDMVTEPSKLLRIVYKPSIGTNKQIVYQAKLEDYFRSNVNTGEFESTVFHELFYMYTYAEEFLLENYDRFDRNSLELISAMRPEYTELELLLKLR